MLPEGVQNPAELELLTQDSGKQQAGCPGMDCTPQAPLWGGAMTKEPIALTGQEHAFLQTFMWVGGCGEGTHENRDLGSLGGELTLQQPRFGRASHHPPQPCA